MTIAVPFMQAIADQRAASLFGGMIVMVFLATNAFDHAPARPDLVDEYYAYPCPWYDNRDVESRLSRNGSAQIPGER